MINIVGDGGLHEGITTLTLLTFKIHSKHMSAHTIVLVVTKISYCICVLTRKNISHEIQVYIHVNQQKITTLNMIFSV